MSTLDTVREIVAEHADLPGRDDDPLQVESFVLVVVAEALEDRFGIRVAAREMRPENFGTIARIAAYVEGKRA
ncbi:MAG: acyl carrier protein [Myxococcales bacterium]|nr:acyl carrier protein [Myxococcales bacterium]